jgi:hypothetical protein
MDIVCTRDVWMHRIDIARATGRQPILTAGHDDRLIADMVADWASTNHHAFSLHLSGPAGGTYTSGNDGPHLDIDATEWAWTISGHAPGSGLVANPLPSEQRPPTATQPARSRSGTEACRSRR